MQNFISQANIYGTKRQPCFFYIDFEQRKPVILPLATLDPKQIAFSFPKKGNTEPQSISMKLGWHELPKPIDFETYQQGFDIVQAGLKQGNSYLLNLTFSTEVFPNATLEEIFYATDAPFKLYVAGQFVCFSPEAFVKTQNNQILTFPMKGTFTTTPERLARDKSALLANTKEQREHYTIVDLMRNDLAMVAQNVQVKRFRYVEEIVTGKNIILQTSSEICGDLGENWQDRLGDMIASLLPAGSISGAPKEKTVEIIQDAEQQERGYYTGIFGYFDGEDLHSAVAIRFIEKRGERYFFHSGGGITLHSHVREEYAELRAKVRFPQREVL